MVQTVKLKYLPYLLEGSNLSSVADSIFNLNKMSFIKKLFKVRSIQKTISELIARINRVEYKKLREITVGGLTIPSEIDTISYQARLEIENLVRMLGEDKKKYVEIVATVIAIVVYKEKFKEPFKEDHRFRSLRHYILDQEMLDCIGVFNTITEKITESNKSWSEKFESVKNEDPDFVMAGGYRLQNFNIIAVIEAMCERFNVDFQGAWDLSYLVVQNSLLKQSIQDDIQIKMTKIKERKMKALQKGK